MGIKTEKAYIVVCDKCGDGLEFDAEYTPVFFDRDEAKQIAIDSDWVFVGRKCFCPDCK